MAFTFSYLHRLAQSTGWRRNAIAFVLGVSGTLTLPPFFIFPLIVTAYGGLFLLVNAAPTAKRAFLDGWWWGWGFYMTGLYWFCIALLTDAEKFAWLIPFALFGLTAVIAIYCGVACYLTARTPVRGIPKIFIFTVWWIGVEFARGHLFTGFPWNLAGYAFAVSDAMIQSAALIGAYGLTWWAVWLGAVPAAFLLDRRQGRMLVALSCFLLAVSYGWGAWRLAEADALSAIAKYKTTATVRLVQANIAQHHKWDPKLQFKGLEEYIKLTASPGIDHVTHVIWPETAVPYVVEEHSPLTRILGDAIPEGKILITGAMHSQGEADNFHIWNSLIALDHHGEIVAQYKKSKLVPFGEFLPLRALLPEAWLKPIGSIDFSAGEGPVTLAIPGLPAASPLICYEAIFPELAVSKTERPLLLVNVTNDAWFGTSSGPYQHYTMARLRAVEQGIQLLRVANTGITATIDAYGRTRQELALGKKGFLDVPVFESQRAPTFYATYHEYPFFALLILFAILTIKKQKSLKINKIHLQVVI